MPSSSSPVPPSWSSQALPHPLSRAPARATSAPGTRRSRRRQARGCRHHRGPRPTSVIPSPRRRATSAPGTRRSRRRQARGCRADRRPRPTSVIPSSGRLTTYGGHCEGSSHQGLQPSAQLEDVPPPDPGRGQVLVKLEASGLCHTDIHARTGTGLSSPRCRFIPGHEEVGVVEQLGTGVKDLQRRRPGRSPLAWVGMRGVRAVRLSP